MHLPLALDRSVMDLWQPMLELVIVLFGSQLASQIAPPFLEPNLWQLVQEPQPSLAVASLPPFPFWAEALVLALELVVVEQASPG